MMDSAMDAPTTTSKKWSGLALGGALATGFVASACCLGPLVFALLGIGGAGFLLKFQAYRPLFVAMTFALLGTGFYFAYRRPKAALLPTSDADGGASADACGCQMPRANRAGRVMLWVVTALVGFFLAFPYLAQLLWG